MSYDRGRSTSDQILDYIKQGFHEGNIRDVVFTSREGKVTRVPLTIVVVAVLLVPPLLVVVAILALAQGYSISIQMNRDSNGSR
jgi:hypothetical protein